MILNTSIGIIFERCIWKMAEKKQKIGITACSDGLSTLRKNDVENLAVILSELSFEPIFSEYIYAKDNCFQGTGRQRAEALMHFYLDNEIRNIFDISGGDIANDIIRYLDFEIIKKSDKIFWGYSDITVIINAIYTKTGKSSVLYQIKNLTRCKERRINFEKYFMEWDFELFEFPYYFVNGSHMSGILIGGNIRCFLKLAGTEYFPDMCQKILLLESFGGGLSKLVTYLAQLKMLNVFDKISGILLGTFTEIESENGSDIVCEIVKKYAGDIPIVKTQYVGHGIDSYAVKIGNYYEFNKKKKQ